MWLMTTLGFFSATCARLNHGRGPGIDVDLIMVRARTKAHLEALQGRFPAELGTLAIISTPSNDYPYRLLVPKTIWAALVADLVLSTNFDNFKSAAAAVAHGPEGQAYLHSLHETWALMRGIELPRTTPLRSGRQGSVRRRPPRT